MKYLNIILLVIFTSFMISCGGEKAKATQTEESESMEMDDEDKDEIIEDETDESDYLEAAMAALESGDTNLAAAEIKNAIQSIKNYIGELDNPSEAKTAIAELTKIAASMKNGTAMTAYDLKKAILSLALFSDYDMEIEEEPIEE